MGQLIVPIRSRFLRPETWTTYLISEDGTRYALGTQLAGPETHFSVPAEVPDGSYRVEVVCGGLAWQNLIRKTEVVIRIDRNASEPVTPELPILSGLRYEIVDGWLKLLWEGDIPTASSGLVSAGIWLSKGEPNFSTAPTVLLPLFSTESTHSYIIAVNPAAAGGSWVDGTWHGMYWPGSLWAGGGGDYMVGLAAVDAAGTVGTGTSIVIPDRTVQPPLAVVEEG